ncbi:unnamed protein product [Enterobius vermicularis]|uniref:Large ribosomal subunit protein bL9m n=1 Tax=Enterobius vermicularis TaxID=51028 RepID=A0A0N4V5X3_ENTVE|nr:unnamed protein product [Enterobius vermicularis]
MHTLEIVIVYLQSTWVLRRVVVPEATPEGQFQRDPEELPIMMRYEVVENENEKDPGSVKIILLEDVEGVGNQFDVVEVNRDLARNNLILGRKAVYASPFDLKYYSQLREKMKDELEKKVRIPYDYILVARELVKIILPIHVSLVNPWTLDRSILHCSLAEKGIFVDEDAVFSPKKEYKGPDIGLEGQLVRFYLVVCKQYIVPMVGRISHITSDTSKQPAVVTDEELLANGLVKEEPLFYKSPVVDSTFDVNDLMERRSKGMI